MTEKVFDNELTNVVGGLVSGASFDPSQVGTYITDCRYNLNQFKAQAGSGYEWYVDRILTYLEAADDAIYSGDCIKAVMEVNRALIDAESLDQRNEYVQKAVTALNNALKALRGH